MTDAALSALTASGPLAVILGLAIIVLWKSWAAERAEVKRLQETRATEIRDTTAMVGRLEEIARMLKNGRNSGGDS